MVDHVDHDHVQMTIVDRVSSWSILAGNSFSFRYANGMSWEGWMQVGGVVNILLGTIYLMVRVTMFCTHCYIVKKCT